MPLRQNSNQNCRSRLRRCVRTLMAIMAIAVLTTLPANAGTGVQLPWATADAGGGTLVNGALRQDATIGQVEGGNTTTLNNGALILRAGYWSNAGAETPLFANGFE